MSEVSLTCCLVHLQWFVDKAVLQANETMTNYIRCLHSPICPTDKVTHLSADQTQHPLLCPLHQWCVVALKGGLSTRPSRSNKGCRTQQGAAAIYSTELQGLVCRVDQCHLVTDASNPAWPRSEG